MVRERPALPMIGRVGIVLAGLVVAGCVSPFPPAENGPSGWTFEVEPAMAPDFAGERGTYPVLLVHEHRIASERERREREGVVCLTDDGEPLPLALPSADAMAAKDCAGPVADPPTGRVFLDRAEFERRGAVGLVLFTSACDGGALHLTRDLRSFRVATEGHDFHVRLLDDGSFVVDGRRIEPGTLLKVGYFLDEGDPEDERYVRVVFEAPGRWRLDGLVGPAARAGIVPHPERGTGLVAETSAAPRELGEAVEAAIAATPARAVGIDELRYVHDGRRLTEVSFRLATEEGDVAWYLASREADRISLLGRALDGPRERSPVALDAMAPLLDLAWARLHADAAGLLDVRLRSDAAWSTLGSGERLALPTDPPCGDEGCVRVWEDGAWRLLPAAATTTSEGEATLWVHPVAGSAGATHWHVPRAPAGLPSQQG